MFKTCGVLGRFYFLGPHVEHQKVYLSSLRQIWSSLVMSLQPAEDTAILNSPQDMDAGKLWHLGFLSLIPYLPEEAQIMHLSMWGLALMKNILFSCLLCSLKSCMCVCGVCPSGQESPEAALQLRFVFGAWRAAPCCCVLPSSLGKGRRGRDPISCSSLSHWMLVTQERKVLFR